METITTLKALKDEFRKAKLKSGDLRGLKNRFSLSKRLGIAALHTFYVSVAPNEGKRVELVADCYEQDGTGTIYAYTMKDLIEEIKDTNVTFEINLIALIWNKARTDAERKEVSRFLFKNEN